MEKDSPTHLFFIALILVVVGSSFLISGESNGRLGTVFLCVGALCFYAYFIDTAEERAMRKIKIKEKMEEEEIGRLQEEYYKEVKELREFEDQLDFALVASFVWGAPIFAPDDFGNKNPVLYTQKREILLKAIQSCRTEVKKARMAGYRKLRKEIETMPEYERWRKAVFEKFGRKCAMCGSTENLEIDHRYLSFYAIIKKYGIINTVQAYECAVLWDVNNGAPLCKKHHDQTTSSMYYRQKS